MQRNSVAELNELTRFFAVAKEDPRIGTSHISLYMALLQFYHLNQFQNPVSITRTNLMNVAKIQGLATYHKCMRDLTELGYIQYFPSFNPAVNSTVILPEL